MSSYRKQVDADVLARMPGTWAWQVAYRVPHQFRWTLETLGDDQSILFDGANMRHQLGEAALPATPPGPDVWSQARWFGATSLDVLETEDVTWRPVAEADLPTGSTSGVRVRFAGSPEEIALFFDERDLLVRARGFLAMPPVGAGHIDATFSDYRPVEGYLLPYRAEYTLEGQPFARETVRWWKPNDSPLERTGYFAGQ